MTCQDLIKVTGRRLLFVGVYSKTWTLAQWSGAAAWAASHGLDSLLIKVADGTQGWYPLAQWKSIRAAVQGHGVGAIPYVYSYGNKYIRLDYEAAIIRQYLQSDQVVCVDMEAEWNGHSDWAKSLLATLDVPGTLLISTWGDPNEQAWADVIKTLNPRVSAYMPQQYDDWLAGKWGEFAADGAKCLIPTVDLTADFGPNNPVAIAQSAKNQGHVAICAWHYGSALANPGVLDQVLKIYPKGNTVIPPIDPYATNPNLAREFNQCWDSTAALFAGTPPEKGSGIFQEWVKAWLAGHQFGPPLTREYSSVNGAGQLITVQQFAGARAEDLGGKIRWYSAMGEVSF